MEDKLFDIWQRRDGHFETWLEDKVIKVLSDYGVGASKLTSAKGKIFGGGYEVYIVAFFIGLYSNQKLELTGDIKKFGQPIQYWGHLESRMGRKSYYKIVDYIFAALVAKCDIDFIALEKGEIEPTKVANDLIEVMDQYANYGFYQIYERLRQNSYYFARNSSFLDWIQELVNPNQDNNSSVGSEDCDPL